MDILAAYEQIKALYQNNVTNPAKWRDATELFATALENTHSPRPLEEVALRDENWELSVDQRLALLHRAKKLGASSHAFLCDYYGYVAMYTDPGPEHDALRAKFEELMSQSG